MPKKGLSRGRGPRIREDELNRMMSLYLEGKSFKAIGQEVGRHWQTVRKYVIKTLQERPGRELRREALKEALVGHFQDLVQALKSLTVLVRLPEGDEWEEQEWWPTIPHRRDRLLLQALRESHAKESPLWAWWDRWNQYRKAYQEALAALRLKVSQEMTELQKSSSGAGVTFTEYLAPLLYKRGVSMARGSPLYDPSMLEINPSANPERRGLEDLWLAKSTPLATGQDMASLLRYVSDIMKNMAEWAEVEALERLYLAMAETREKIEEEVEVLSLRRAFPEHCRLCPV